MIADLKSLPYSVTASIADRPAAVSTVTRAVPREPAKAGMRKLMSSAMTPMTTRSSMSVKPRRNSSK
jgi:hypothetical protein